MKLARFESFASTSVEETCTLLTRYDDAEILAGGQSPVHLLALCQRETVWQTRNISSGTRSV